MTAALPTNSAVAEPSRFWILTATTGRFDLANPRGEAFEPAALARQLSQISAWNGNTQFLYSVAQRAVLVASTITDPGARIYGLLNSAPAIVLGDMQLGAKDYLIADGTDTMALERRTLAAVWKQFGLRPPTAEIAGAVDIAHARVLATEYRDVVLGKDPLWTPPGQTLSRVIKFRKRIDVELEFLDALEHYSRAAS